VGGGSGIAATDAFTGAAGAVSFGAAGVLAPDRVRGDDGRDDTPITGLMKDRGKTNPVAAG
jgi:hypothetical protein